MSTNETYLAVFLGSKTSPRMAAWNALPEEERRANGRCYEHGPFRYVLSRGGPNPSTPFKEGVRVTGKSVRDHLPDQRHHLGSSLLARDLALVAAALLTAAGLKPLVAHKLSLFSLFSLFSEK